MKNSNNSFKKLTLTGLHEAKGRVESHVLALKQVIKKAREEGDIDTETEAQQRLTSSLVEQDRIARAAKAREDAPSSPPVQQPQLQQPQPQEPVVDVKAEEMGR